MTIELKETLLDFISEVRNLNESLDFKGYQLMKAIHDEPTTPRPMTEKEHNKCLDDAIGSHGQG